MVLNLFFRSFFVVRSRESQDCWNDDKVISEIGIRNLNSVTRRFSTLVYGCIHLVSVAVLIFSNLKRSIAGQRETGETCSAA
jgi:hypothetical protein